MHRYVLEHRVSHADVDLLGEVKVTALLGLLEQAAVEASWDCGFGPEWYADQGRVWLIRRTRLERWTPVGGGDLLRTATEVLDWRRARSLRSYEIRRGARDGSTRGDGRDPLVARATTDWVYCDLASGRPVKIPEPMQRAFSGDGPLPVLPRARSLIESGADEAVEMGVIVRPSLLDHVTHVNNAAYAAFLEDGAFELFAARGLGVERMLALGGALRIHRIDLEYLDDAVAGDALVVRSWLLPDAAGARAEIGSAERPRGARLAQTIARENGERILRAASEWVWRVRPAVLGGVPSG
jgi:acyl-CoA thioester hydrolase